MSLDVYPPPLAKDYYQEIAAGNVTGVSPVNKFGAGNIPAGTTADVWDGSSVQAVYAFPTTATITHIRQATDQAAMRGETIQIQGLDANWDLVVQTADLDATNTTTEVELTTPLLRVFRMKVHANVVISANIWAGATGVAAATAKAIIRDDHNQTLMAIYTVPAGKTAYMTQWYADNTPDATKIPDSVKFDLRAADRAAGYEFQVKSQRGISLQGAGFIHEFKPYLKFTEKTDIKILAKVVGSVGKDGNPHAGFDLILVDN